LDFAFSGQWSDAGKGPGGRPLGLFVDGLVRERLVYTPIRSRSLRNSVLAIEALYAN